MINLIGWLRLVRAWIRKQRAEGEHNRQAAWQRRLAHDYPEPPVD